jgi:ADP-heptose:LPS heptosyltransferase
VKRSQNDNGSDRGAGEFGGDISSDGGEAQYIELQHLSGAPRRIGFDRQWAREGGAALLYTDRVTPAGRHVAELNYSLAEKAGASRPPRPEYPLRVPAGGAASIRARLADLGIGGYIVVGPGGSWRAKCWPVERYGEFCRLFEQRYTLPTVVILIFAGFRS